MTPRFTVDFGSGATPAEPDGRLHAPAFARNHEPIWAAIGPWLAAQTGDVLELASGTGQHSAAYALRARADAVSFRNAWDSALDFAIRRLSDAVLSRAINGVPRAVFFQGEQIGENRYYDERLAMFLLRLRDPLHYGKWLDRREFSGHPEGSAIDLAVAKCAVREDAGLGADEVAERVALRHAEIAEKMQLAEHSTPAAEPAAKTRSEGDVS